MKEDHGLVRGITTTLVDGATMFFFGAWDYHVFFFCACGCHDFSWCVGLRQLLFGVWGCHNLTFVGVWNYPDFCSMRGITTALCV